MNIELRRKDVWLKFNMYSVTIQYDYWPDQTIDYPSEYDVQGLYADLKLLIVRQNYNHISHINLLPFQQEIGSWAIQPPEDVWTLADFISVVKNGRACDRLDEITSITVVYHDEDGRALPLDIVHVPEHITGANVRCSCFECKQARETPPPADDDFGCICTL